MDRRARTVAIAATVVAGLAAVTIAAVLLAGDAEAPVDARRELDAGRAIAIAKDAGAGDAGIPEPARPGWPMVDRSLPRGTLRASLRRGYDGNGPPVAGATVHLVTTRVGGAFEHRTLATSATGEVEVAGLITDGTAAYYLLAEVDGDRIESAPVTPRPDAGLRVELLARVTGSRLPPIEGIGPPVDPVPAGEALVQPFPDPDPTAKIELVDPGSTAVVAGGVDGDGMARFSGLEPGTVHIARMQRAGRIHLSTPFLVVAGRGVRRQLWAAPMPIARCRYSFEPGRGPLPFTVELVGWMECQLVQYDGAPHAAPAGGLSFPLPAGIHKAELDPEVGPGARLHRGGVLWSRPLPPGGLTLRARFRLPVAGGRAEIAIDPGFRLYAAEVSMVRGDGTAFAGPAAATSRILADEDGIDFHVLQVSDVQPGSPLRLTITGLRPPGPCHDLVPNIWQGGDARPAPEITGTDRDGTQHRLAELRGKVVVLNLWASWCPPCREELASLAALQRRFPRDQVIVLALSSDPTWAAAGPLADPHRDLTFWLDPPIDPDRNNIGAMASGLGTRRLPETYLIDRRGNVRHRVVNTRDWNSPAATACIDGLIGDLGP